jgi:DNA-binding NtrC family response regulator
VDSVLSGHETVLLVEDEAAVRDITAQTLSQYGYQVLTAENGDAALRVFRQHKGEIDLLITDVIMPLMGGKALAETLVKEKPGLKIMFISGYTDNSIVHHGVLEKDVEFLQKPYLRGELLNKVREVLDKAGEM